MTPIEEEVFELFKHDWEDAEGFTLMEDDEWSDEGKYSYRCVVVEYKDRYFQIGQTRSGSYHSDYYYDDPEVTEVSRHEERVMITRVHWDAIK